MISRRLIQKQKQRIGARKKEVKSCDLCLSAAKVMATNLQTYCFFDSGNEKNKNKIKTSTGIGPRLIVGGY